MSGYWSKRRRTQFRRTMEEARPYAVRGPRRGNNSREQHHPAGDPVVPHSPLTPQPPEFESRFDIGVKLLADLVEEVRATRRELQELKAQVATVQNALSVPVAHLDPPDLLVAPLDQQSELTKLESQLAGDANSRESLELHLSTKGGKNAKDAVYRMMPCIMTNKLAKTINWTGQGGKMAFRNFKLKDILHRAMRRNSNLKEVTEELMQYEVTRYLKGAADRDGGRKKLKVEDVWSMSPDTDSTDSNSVTANQ